METTLTFNLIESDKAASQEALLTMFEAFWTDRDTYVQKIADAVNAVFDRESDGTRINLPHVASLTIAELKVSPKEYGKWEDRVLEYVRSNSKGEGALFDIGKGTKNGGVARKVKTAPVTKAASVSNESTSSTEMVAAAE